MRDLWLVTSLACLMNVLVACSSTSTSECGSVICPTSKVCYTPLELCVDSEQLTTCVALEDGESCDFPGALNGRCLGEICVDTVCGNGSVDFGEICDDGNTESGDGCSADCRSDETCGNGSVDLPREQCDDSNLQDGDGCQSTCLFARCGDEIVDPGEACDDGNLVSDDGCNQVCTSDETCGNGFADFQQGEQCDDGDFLSQDGCTSVCTAELPLWSEKPLEAANGRQFGRMVFHAARSHLALYGGTGPIGEPAQEIQEFRSQQWSSPLRRPALPKRKEHVFVYDNARQVALAFGGVLPIAQGPGMPTPPPQSPYGDTWEFGLLGWNMIATTISPSARLGANGAYDAMNRHIVVFGGNDGTDLLGDTWTYDGNWELAANFGPSPREGHLMAYDHARERLVLFGGVDESGANLNDTWEWNSGTWSEVTSAVIAPEARGTMAYLPGTGIVAFGGRETPSNSTWIFDGTTWSESPGSASGPSARVGAAMEFDPSRAALIMFGGGPGLSLRDVWSFDGATWTQVLQSFSPIPRQAALLSHDSLRRKTYYYGGRTGPGQVFGDLWEWDGTQYLEVEDVGEPTPTRDASAFFFDSDRGCHLMFRAGPTEMETFTLCGRVWTKVNTVNSPPARGQASIAFDPTRAKVLLFGGRTDSSRFNDTWELNGDTWTQLLVDTAPSARTSAMMQYDSARTQMLLFGGSGPNGNLNDTWVFDGTAWSEVITGERPSPRFGPGMVYNAPRGRVMIHGGEPGPIGDSWEFDGETWVSVREPQRPAPRPFPAISFDSTRKRVIFAGNTPFDTWEFSYSATNQTEVCIGNMDEDLDGLVDCGDPDCNESRCGPGAMVCRAEACVCARATETLCGDEFDGDCDGLVDCEDPDCGASPDCIAELDCSDGIDNDLDGRQDCADLGCHGIGDCEAFESMCEDGIDNDGDGKIDCQDLDCFLVPCMEVTP